MDESGRKKIGKTVEIKSGSKEYEGRFELSDGHVIRMRTIILQVVQLEGKDQMGLPAYGVKSQNILFTEK